MNKKYFLSIGLLSIIFFFLNVGNFTMANQSDQNLGEKYKQVGYKSIEESIKEFENHFKKNVTLPKRTPPISFTHHFGRFYEDKQYKINDFLEIKYVNEYASENNFKIDIRPSKNKLTFNNTKQKQYTLENGTNAVYFEDTLFNCLVFEINDWQYIIGIDKRLSESITPNSLIKIANSI